MAEWEIDLREINGLRQWWGKQKRLVQVASAQLLNRFAYGTYEGAYREIDRRMIVRNSGFVKSRLRYTKALASTPIGSQVSRAGSTKKDRFSGWVEQEQGKPTSRHRFATLAGRSGSKLKQIRPKVRLKPAHEVLTIEDYRPRGGSGNIRGFVAMLIRKKENRLFRIAGSIYKRNTKVAYRKQLHGPTTTTRPLYRGGIEHVQSLQTKQPKRMPWLRTARAKYFKANPPQATWNRIASQLMRPPRGRT